MTGYKLDLLKGVVQDVLERLVGYPGHAVRRIEEPQALKSV
jgi:hypothetical protein